MDVAVLISSVFFSIGATFLYYHLITTRSRLKHSCVKWTTGSVFVLYIIGKYYILMTPYASIRADSFVNRISGVLFTLSIVGYVMMVYLFFKKVAKR